MSGTRILAIESSCDETGVAVGVGGRRIEAKQVGSQGALHAATGGIVPEVAARQQLRWIVPTIEAALAEAACVMHIASTADGLRALLRAEEQDNSTGRTS